MVHYPSDAGERGVLAIALMRCVVTTTAADAVAKADVYHHIHISSS